MANLLQSAGGAGNKRFHTSYLQPSSALLGYPLSFFQRRGSSLLTLSLSDLKLTYFVWHAKTRCLVGPTAAKIRWLEILHPLSVEYRRHLQTPTPFGTSLTHLAERHQTTNSGISTCIAWSLLACPSGPPPAPSHTVSLSRVNWVDGCLSRCWPAPLFQHHSRC
jgi:hypothetical protein